jgi:UDP-N-acetyl-D-mannosaminuronic acid dehydrogenase
MDSKTQTAAYDICVVGGAGHVGIPLALVFARQGFRTLIYDINKAVLEKIASGRLPFLEQGGPQLLAEVLSTGRLGFSSDVESVTGIPNVIVTIGTPIDEFHNPLIRVVDECVDTLLPYLSEAQLIVLRSTVFPGVTDHVHRYLAANLRHKPLLAFCPERVVQGHSIEELQTLPQIVSATSDEAEERAAQLFSAIAPSIVRMIPKEAEFAKLLCNAYRYIQFAATNQFYMMVEAEGLNYHRLLAGLKQGYSRMRDLPGPGLSAGPCLFKDTLQLAAFSNHQFSIGYSAIQVNEGLPAFLLSRLEKTCRLREATVGLLGMAFKAESDDIRASLSYKIKKLLRHRAHAVLTTDPFVTGDPELQPLDEVVRRSDILVLCVPHRAYRQLDLRGKTVVDLWNLYPEKQGTGSIGVVRTVAAEGDER